MIKPMSDDAETAPNVARRDVSVSVPTETLNPGERSEIVIAVKSSLWRPTLYLTPSTTTIIVDSILCGQICINRTPRYAHEYAEGVQITDTVSPRRPLKIVVMNAGLGTAEIGAQLVARRESGQEEKTLSFVDLLK